jgi:hypothetical protein
MHGGLFIAHPWTLSEGELPWTKLDVLHRMSLKEI